MTNLVGTLVGAAIDRRDGDSGIKGAIVGSVVQSAVRVAMPLVATYAIGWAILFTIRNAKGALFSTASQNAEDIVVTQRP